MNYMGGLSAIRYDRCGSPEAFPALLARYAGN